jgi:PIN domain nuclease of toxin-antitoxin system
VAVLDASALLALILVEPGAARVQAAIGGAHMSTVNLAEALARLRRDGADPSAMLPALSETGIRWHRFDEDDAVATALLAPLTAARGLSFGDRACLALGQRLGEPVLTADRAWAGLELGVAIETIR